MPDRSDKIFILVETAGMSLVREIAETGWLVEVALREPNQQSDSRYFAVGLGNAIAAEEAVLRYPGILQTDKRSARRSLTSTELLKLGLRTEAVRPYR